LIRFGPVGQEKPGVQLENGNRLDVSAFFPTYDETFFATDGIARLHGWLATGHYLAWNTATSRPGRTLNQPQPI
jgi:hypothetical protein